RLDVHPRRRARNARILRAFLGEIDHLRVRHRISLSRDVSERETPGAKLLRVLRLAAQAADDQEMCTLGVERCAWSAERQDGDCHAQPSAPNALRSTHNA